jgi:hypothetical protein
MSMPQVPATPSRGRPQDRTAVGAKAIPAWGIVLLAVLLVASAVLALYGLWSFWPAPPPASGPLPGPATFAYFGWHRTLTRDQQFFVVAALAGVIGAMLHGLRSLATYAGERYLFRSWILYYVLLPFVGALLSTIVYLVLRAGLLPGGTAASQPDPYGIAAIGALVGLFSAQAAEKLKAVFETLFTKAEIGNQSISDVTLPVIDQFRPDSGPVGTPVVISGDRLELVTSVEFTDAKQADITEKTGKQITVSVPDGAVTGPITLRAGQQQVTSEQDFTVSA